MAQKSPFTSLIEIPRDDLVARLDSALLTQAIAYLTKANLSRDASVLRVPAQPTSYAAVHHLECVQAIALLHQRQPQKLADTGVTTEMLKALLAASLEECYQHLESDGCVAGPDIDAIRKPYWHADLAPIAFDVLHLADGTSHPALQSAIRLSRRSAEAMAPRFLAYARGETVAYRGLNLIFQDIAGMAAAGKYFGIQEWADAAEIARKRALGRQHEEGYFPDARDMDIDRGPSSVYARYGMLTITPLLMLRPDDAVAEQIARGLSWVFAHLLSSRETVDIVDERERYHIHSNVSSGCFSFPPLWAYFRGGRQFLSEHLAAGRQPDSTSVARFWTFTWSVQDANPNFFEILEKAGDWKARREQFAHCYTNKKSAVSVSQPWTLAAHGYLAPALPPRSMWHRDLQQHFSVYHHNAGVIFGGGNSLAQPEFSTLLAGGSFLCDEVVIVLCEPGRLALELTNSGVKLRVHCMVVIPEECQIHAQVLATADAHAFLQVPLCFYDHRETLLCDDELITDFSAAERSGTFSKNIEVRGRGAIEPYTAQISVSQPCSYRWPVLPVNVRVPGGEPMPLGNAMMPLKFKLGTAGSEIRITVRVTARK
jgi:hypothetical protein